MSEIEHGLRLYVCPDCYLTKMDAAQMPVHDRDCGGKFKPVEYVPAERLQGSVDEAAERIFASGILEDIIASSDDGDGRDAMQDAVAIARIAYGGQ